MGGVPEAAFGAEQGLTKRRSRTEEIFVSYPLGT
jgi:hypothetical protein